MDAQPSEEAFIVAPDEQFSSGADVENFSSRVYSSSPSQHPASPARRSPNKRAKHTSKGAASSPPKGDASGSFGRKIPKVQPKFRNWCFTINNPSVDEAGIAIAPKPELWPRHVYSIWQLERGENGTMHWQGYVEFSGQFSLSQLKNNCPELASAHLEGRRGSADQAVAYCTPNKGGAVRDATVLSESPLEFGARKQVLCGDCYFYLYRSIVTQCHAIGFYREDYTNVINQMYFEPGENGCYEPCGCITRPIADRWPPSVILTFTHDVLLVE